MVPDSVQRYSVPTCMLRKWLGAKLHGGVSGTVSLLQPESCGTRNLATAHPNLRINDSRRTSSVAFHKPVFRYMPYNVGHLQGFIAPVQGCLFHKGP